MDEIIDEIINALLTFEPKSKREGIGLYDEACLGFPENEWSIKAYSKLNNIFGPPINERRDQELDATLFGDELVVLTTGVSMLNSYLNGAPDSRISFQFIMGRANTRLITYLYQHQRDWEKMPFQALKRIIITHHAFSKADGQVTFDNFFDKRFVIDCKEYTF